MGWIVQSTAFKILRTRLKTVPPCSLNVEQSPTLRNSNMKISHPIGSQMTNDITLDSSSVPNGINFDSRLQQFEQMQKQHREHAKRELQRRKIATLSSKEHPRSAEHAQPAPVPDIIQPPARTSRRGPGQLQL